MKKNPKVLKDFLIYLTAIKGKSKRTRDEYEYDLTLFFKFLIALERDLDVTNLKEVSIDEVDVIFMQKISLEDMYLFLEYCEEVRKNSAVTRARKVATLKSFFKYLKTKNV
ncbi:site-specific integrase [Kurthia senegalensis]|uniref:site-specific integrase n=1 Tax=Kurthia senegalensis TaxID=1033740 RepID=UPI0002D29AEA|nr:site-specific integrase [Kurthia senegalensis]